jgi:pimeloyl-ACP methyl ester carboxylesterase
VGIAELKPIPGYSAGGIHVGAGLRLVVRRFRVVAIESAGHFPMHETPAALATAIEPIFPAVSGPLRICGSKEPKQ